MIKAGHIDTLDGLRALAIAGVLVHHFGTGRLELGTYGVLLFFVISGFLITGILVRIKGQIASGALTMGSGLKLFYVRRLLRIFPIYYLTLFVLFLYNAPGVRQHIGWQALYATNLWVAIHHHFEPATGPFWSLAVEEQFYLLWPIIVFLMPMRFLRTLILSLALFAVAFRVVGVFVFHLDSLTTNTLLPGCLDSLALGALLALGNARDAAWISRLGVFASIAVIAEVALELIDKGTVLRLGTLDLFCVLSAAGAVKYAITLQGGAAGKLLSCRPLTALGIISYGTYVYHMPLHVLTGLSGFKISILTLLVASLSWHLIEKPINSLKSRFKYTGERSATEIVPAQVYSV